MEKLLEHLGIKLNTPVGYLKLFVAFFVMGFIFSLMGDLFHVL